MYYFGEDVHVMWQRSPIMWPIFDFFWVDWNKVATTYSHSNIIKFQRFCIMFPKLIKLNINWSFLCNQIWFERNLAELHHHVISLALRVSVLSLIRDPHEIIYHPKWELNHHGRGCSHDAGWMVLKFCCCL